MKTFFCSLAILFCVAINAQEFTTDGSGKRYSFSALSEIPGSNVKKTADEGVFIIDGRVIIDKNDSFSIAEEKTIYFDGEGELVINGEANLVAGDEGLTLSMMNQDYAGSGIDVKTTTNLVAVENISFEGVGLRNYSTNGMTLKNCSFEAHNGAASGALFLGADGSLTIVKDCSFSNCQKAAIGGAANFFCPIIVEDCEFHKNSQANGNIPQLNLTAASEVTIRNCEVEGDPSLNMVGGIGISNFYGTEGFNITVSDCHIYNNRYGFTSMGVMDVVLKNNTIENNCYETNPNNGGSGISLYDPYLKQTAIISGNTITGNLWGITVIGCGMVNLGCIETDNDLFQYNEGRNIFANNGNEGSLYDLYNNSSNTVYAQNNTWGVDIQDKDHIESVIFHNADDASLGEVIYMPAFNEGLSIEKNTGTTNAKAEIFNLSGHRLDRLTRGINIVGGRKIVKK